MESPGTVGQASASSQVLWARIPAELRDRPQWCITPGTDTDKAPRTTSGAHAKTTDPATWCSFDAACTAAAARGWRIGYVLHENDPFACIDLDVKDHTTPDQMARFQHIVNQFDSYTERSRSGKGMHVWVQGKIGKGRRRDGVEVYSQERFIICTGNVWCDKPISPRYGWLNLLVAEMDRGTKLDVELEDVADQEERDDWYIAQLALEDTGELGRLFKTGEWEGKYQSASEADLALVTFLARITDSNKTCWGAFQMSPLGKREKNGKVKSNRPDYMRGTLTLARTSLANEALQIARGKEIADAIFFRMETAAPTTAGTLTAKPLRLFLDESVIVEFLIDDIFRRGWLYTITGMTGAGKTGIAVYFALAIADGRTIDKYGVQKGPVLYIAGENPDDVRGRFRAMMEHGKWSEEAVRNVHVIDQSFLLEERLADLMSIVAAIGPVAVIVDTDQAVSLHGDGEENSNNGRMKHAKNLRQLTRHESRPTIIDLCHPNASSKPDILRPRGGSSFLNEIDGNVRCWREEPVTTLANDTDKWRGTAFELSFRKQDVEVAGMTDQHGRKVVLPLYWPATDLEASKEAYGAYAERSLLLKMMHRYPAMSQVDLLVQLGWKTRAGQPDKPKISRLIKRLREEDPPLVHEHGGLTKEGQKAAKGFA